MHKQYLVRLAREERSPWVALTRQGQAAAYKISQAPILLNAEAEGPAWTAAKIAERVSVSVHPGLSGRPRGVEPGLEAALNRKQQGRPCRPALLDGAGQARRLALMCREPPARACPLDAPAVGRPGRGRGGGRGDPPRDGTASS